MSNIIRNKLVEVYNELTGVTNSISALKTDIADALRYNGVTNVGNDEDFSRYVELIRRLRNPNSMVLEFSIPESATTEYKRTIVLPMYFGVGGNNGGSLNAIALDLVHWADRSGTTTHDLMEEDDSLEELIEEHTIRDVYGNLILDGNFTIPMDYNGESAPQEENTPSLFSDSIDTRAAGEDGTFEPSTSATYSYTVDWGDGSETYIYDETKTFEENKPAIYHTYANNGVYDVTISGTFKKLYTQGRDQQNFVLNNQYVTDVDGTIVRSNTNYGVRSHLIEVIAWGNTLLTDMEDAFCQCTALHTIPMYDTTNSFADVTSFRYAFRGCTALTELPFNANTNRGLFSGCEKATSFQGTFRDCSGLREPIPAKLIDGCINVTNVAEMFAYDRNMQGGIPLEMFSGLSSLQDASEVFADNVGMNGTISSVLFRDCPNLTSIYRAFYNCTGLTGVIDDEFISGKSRLNNMRQAFYNCRGITAITANAFSGITSDNIDARQAFHNCGFTEIPQGLMLAFTGKNLWFERMFDSCTALTSIASDAVASLKVANARGIFSNCTHVTTTCPTENEDWKTYEGMKRWYGAFAKTTLSDINSICLELGGNGDRKFPEGNVGAIVLEDETLVDPKDYVYSASNRPMGIVYADVYLNPDASVSTIANNAGNVVSGGTAGGVHKLFACTFNDTTRQWISAENLAEDIPTITNTSTVAVGYNLYNWDNDRITATLSATRYNGEAYTKAINEWRVSKGMATYDGSGYTATASDIYKAVDFVNTYSLNGVQAQRCFLPDGADLWDQFTMKYLMQKACDAIVNGGGGYNGTNGSAEANVYSLRDNAWYWCSAESSSAGAWRCNTGYAYLSGWGAKWDSYYVRGSFAIAI